MAAAAFAASRVAAARAGLRSRSASPRYLIGSRPHFSAEPSPAPSAHSKRACSSVVSCERQVVTVGLTEA